MSRQKYGSVKQAVARLSHLSAPEIVRQTGISRYSVYFAARQMRIKLARAVRK